MSFKTGILPLIKPNSILGIEFLCKWTQTRYQVSSSSSNWPQLDTWYRVATQISLNGHQLGTWYRVDASTGLNSIPGIALRHNAAQIDTKFTSKDKASILPKHRSYDCPIDLQPGKGPSWHPIYNLSPTELEFLRAYIKENLAHGFIRHSKSPAGAPIFLWRKRMARFVWSWTIED